MLMNGVGRTLLSFVRTWTMPTCSPMKRRWLPSLAGTATTGFFRFVITSWTHTQPRSPCPVGVCVGGGGGMYKRWESDHEPTNKALIMRYILKGTMLWKLWKSLGSWLRVSSSSPLSKFKTLWSLCLTDAKVHQHFYKEVTMVFSNHTSSMVYQLCHNNSCSFLCNCSSIRIRCSDVIHLHQVHNHHGGRLLFCTTWQIFQNFEVAHWELPLLTALSDKSTTFSHRRL